ncbi:MAG: hypothetical protein WB683_06640 [Candidatus Sulfotelmatobacter sp.]
MAVRPKARARHRSSNFLQREGRSFSRRPFSRGDNFEKRPAFTVRAIAQDILILAGWPVVTHFLQPPPARTFRIADYFSV